MKLASKFFLVLIVFAVFTAYLITFQLVPHLEEKYLEDLHDEYSRLLEHNLNYIEGYINDISYNIDYLSEIEQLYIEQENYFTSYTNAEATDFDYNPNTDEIDINEFLEKYIASNHAIEDVFIGFKDGSFITINPYQLIGDTNNNIYNYDPRVRPWYIKATRNPNEVIVSPLYQRIRTLEGTDENDAENYYLTVAKTIENDNGEIIGVIGINIGVPELLEHLKASTKNKVDSFGILFDEGVYCSLSENDLTIENTSNDPDLRQILDSNDFNQNSDYFAYYKDSGIFRRETNVVGRIMFYVIDKEMINENTSRFIQPIIFTVVITISLFVIIVLGLMQIYIIAPIGKLNGVTSKISKTMDLSEQFKYNSKDEIGSLAKNFNFIMTEMKDYRDNLDTLVKKRTLELSKFSKVIDQNSSGVVITDINGKIEYANPKFTEMTGYSLEEVIGKKPNVFKSGEHEEEFYKDLWDTVLSGKDWEGVFSNKKKNGEVFFDKSRISPLKDENGNIINFIAIKEDITLRKMVEEELKNVQADNRLILESVGEGIIGVDLEGKVIFANSKSCKLLGYEKDELVNEYLTKVSIKNPKETSFVIDSLQQVIDEVRKSNEVYSQSKVILKKDDNELIAEVTCIPIVRDDSHLGAVMVLKDLTEKYEIENRLEVLFKNMPTGFADHEMIYNENGVAVDYRYLKINDSFKKHTGFTDDILGHTARELLPDLEPAWLDLFGEVVSTKTPNIFEEYEATLGKHFRVNAFSTGKNTFATIFDDITESKQSEKLRVENENRLRFIFETTPFAVFTTIKGIINYANPNFEKMTGLGVQDSIFEAYCDHEDHKKIVDRINMGEQVTNYEARFFNIDGKSTNVLLSCTKTDIDGEKGLLGWLMDISEIKKTETQLILAKELAEAATDAKSDFLANMSHEIRTPMNAVIGLNELLKATELSIKQRDYVNKIKRSASRLLNIINDILDFSKIESGKMETENIEFNMEEVLKDQISILSLLVYEKDIEIIVDKALDVPRILEGDPHRLGQILGNLVNNAIKFTKEGHVLISVENIGVKNGKAIIKFVVSDTGIGMSKEHMDKLFLPFSQADTSTTRRYGGTGLGLIITKELVEIMDGEIVVFSEESKGSSFEVILPFKVIDATEDIYNISNGIEILVIEENQLTRDVVCRYLEQFGYKYTVAASAKQAVGLLREHRFAVILINNSQDEINNVLYSRITTLYSNSNPPKVIFLQNSNKGGIHFADEDEPYTILVKPIFPSNLYNTLSDSLFDESNVKKTKSGNTKLFKEVEKLKKSKILVVEDNEINRLVAKDILINAGFIVGEAENGREAIKEIYSDEYDLVLMDIQMPVLDGYEATEIIRQKYSKQDLPIVALTADAVIETRDKVFSLGMNDYLSKPIDVDKLLSKLVKWLKIKNTFSVPEDTADKSAVIETMKTILYDFSVEDAIKRIGGNIKFYLQILNKYAGENVDLPTELKKSYQSKDYDKFKFIIHSAKGVSAYVGGNTLNNIFIEIEKELKENGPNGRIMTRISDIEKLMKNMLNEIKLLNAKFRGSEIISEAENVEEEQEEIARGLNHLIERIEVRDEDIADLVNNLKFRIGNKNIHGMLDLVTEYVKEAKFDKALAVARNMQEIRDNMNI